MHARTPFGLQVEGLQTKEDVALFRRELGFEIWG